MPPKKITAEVIVDKYMDYVLEHNEHPKNVYTFAKSLKMKESEFYQFFGNFEAIEAHVFEHFFTQTVNLLNADENYASYDAKSKILSFYFTIIEMMTANRSYVNFILDGGKHQLHSLKPLMSLKPHFLQFLQQMEISQLDLKVQGLDDIKEKSEKEIIWNHFLCTVHFWLKDTSAGFEKTDTFIEKSINTGFEFLNTKPLENLFDLGKFLYKEMMR